MAARIRLAVADDADYDRAVAVIRRESHESRLAIPASWPQQKRGLIVAGGGVAVLVVGGTIVGDGPRLVLYVVLGLAFAIMATGITLIVLAPRRDRRGLP